MALAYAPDQIGRGLRRGRAGSIAYCAADMSAADASALIAGCSSRVQRSDTCLVVTCARSTIPHLAKTRRIDGVIFAPGQLRGRRYPVVVSDLGEFKGEIGSLHGIRWDYAKCVQALVDQVDRSGFDGVITVQHRVDDPQFIKQVTGLLPKGARHVRLTWNDIPDQSAAPDAASQKLAVVLSGRNAVKTTVASGQASLWSRSGAYVVAAGSPPTWEIAPWMRALVAHDPHMMGQVAAEVAINGCGAATCASRTHGCEIGLDVAFEQQRLVDKSQ